jgi:hypothetical protein
MIKDTGGPAFPAPAGVSHITEQGMTLRDYFASKAMQAILSNPDYGDEDSSLAGAAYYVADAMLKARQS